MKLSKDQVRARFNKAWSKRIKQVPAYANDLPAKRQFFQVFLDELWADNLITQNMLDNITMEDD